MLGNRLREVRKTKGYSQDYVAKRIGVTRSTVSRWEKEVAVPDTDSMMKLSEILDVEMNAFLGEREPEKTDKEYISERLALITEELSIRNRRHKRFWRIVIGVVIGVVFITIVLLILNLKN